MFSVIGAAIGWLGRPAARVTTSPLTFSIDAPPGTQLGPGYGIVAVSPDGLKVAFIASTSGRASLWVRRLNELNAHWLQGTEGANNPAWSADSRSIIFQTNSQTRIARVDAGDAGGGRVQTLADLKTAGPLSNRSGLCWMPDGTIVFPNGPSLFRMPATGGDPVVMATAEASRNERTYLLPTPIGDTQVLFLVKRTTSELTESQVRTIDGRLVTTLDVVTSNAAFAAGFLIFFTKEHALVAQPYDQQTHTLSKKPILLADGVDYNPGNSRAVFSASASLLVYRPETPRQLVWIDRRGNRLGSIGEIGQDWNPAISRDGSRIAFDRFDAAMPRFRIWITDGPSSATRLTSGVSDRFPVWSGDGQWMAYYAPGLAGSEIHRIRTSGNGEDERLLYEPGGLIPLDWSADSTFLIYEKASDLWGLPLPGNSPRQLTKVGTVDKTARLSADAKWVAYTNKENGVRSIWVQSVLQGSSPRRVSADDAFDPSWRQDGRELYYVTESGEVKAVAVDPGAQLKFGPPVKLFSITPGAINTPLHIFAATPDGQRFLVSESVSREAGFIVVQNWQELVR
jgi:Tol biopolymer transport system component